MDRRDLGCVSAALPGLVAQVELFEVMTGIETNNKYSIKDPLGQV